MILLGIVPILTSQAPAKDSMRYQSNIVENYSKQPLVTMFIKKKGLVEPLTRSMFHHPLHLLIDINGIVDCLSKIIHVFHSILVYFNAYRTDTFHALLHT